MFICWFVNVFKTNKLFQYKYVKMWQEQFFKNKILIAQFPLNRIAFMDYDLD